MLPWLRMLTMTRRSTSFLPTITLATSSTTRWQVAWSWRTSACVLASGPRAAAVPAGGAGAGAGLRVFIALNGIVHHPPFSTPRQGREAASSLSREGASFNTSLQGAGGGPRGPDDGAGLQGRRGEGAGGQDMVPAGAHA